MLLVNKTKGNFAFSCGLSSFCNICSHCTSVIAKTWKVCENSWRCWYTRALVTFRHVPKNKIWPWICWIGCLEKFIWILGLHCYRYSFFPWPLNLSLQPQFKCLVGFELCQKVFEREKVTLNECRPKRNKIGTFKTAREQFHDNKRDSKFNLWRKIKTDRAQCV